MNSTPYLFNQKRSRKENEGSLPFGFLKSMFEFKMIVESFFEFSSTSAEFLFLISFMNFDNPLNIPFASSFSVS